VYKNVTPTTIPAEGTTFVLEMMGREAGPDKFVRELVYNSLQAIDAFEDRILTEEISEPEYKPEIRFYVDPYYEWKWQTPKLAIADNGASFSSVDKFLKIFSHLAVSGSKQGLGLNHGIGGRITTALRNPLGVEYRFWIDGKGYLSRMWREPDSGVYGLERSVWGDKVLEAIPIEEIDPSERPDLMKPDFIESHGFVVVQLGDKNSDDTTLPPEEFLGNKAWWLTTTANRYFADIPKHIRVSSHTERRKDGKIDVRIIDGYLRELEREAQSCDTVELADANVHWYLLRDGLDPAADKDRPTIERTFAYTRFKRRNYFDAWNSRTQQGFVAIMHRDPVIRSLAEFYDFTERAAESVPMLKKFGIYAGYANVVLIVEPHKASANLTRTSLHGPNGKLQYARWADEFSKSMPPALKSWVERHLNADAEDAVSEIHLLIEKNKDQLFFEAFRNHPRGDVRAAVSETETGPTGNRTQKSLSPPSGIPRPERRASPTQRTPRRKETDEVESARAFRQLRGLEPTIVFEHEANNDSLRGRAAQYDTDRSLLTINRDFRSFQNLIAVGTSLLKPEARGDEQVIKKVSRQAEVIYGYDLASTVMIARAHLEGTEDWTTEDFTRLVSAEGLTASVLSRVQDAGLMRQRVRTQPFLMPSLLSAEEARAAQASQAESAA
jgi:hypothetical protein